MTNMNNSKTRQEMTSPALKINSLFASKTSAGGEEPYFSVISQIFLKAASQAQ
jgi:hypothetical protein